MQNKLDDNFPKDYKRDSDIQNPWDEQIETELEINETAIKNLKERVENKHHKKMPPPKR